MCDSLAGRRALEKQLSFDKMLAASGKLWLPVTLLFVPIIAINRKARFDYDVLESYQAGLVLSGRMTKAIRNKQVKPEGAFVVHQNNRLEIVNLQAPGWCENVPLLLKRKEMQEIIGRIREKGLTCLVLNLKTVGRWIKAEIGLARGRTKRDKRALIRQRDLDRELARGLMD